MCGIYLHVSRKAHIEIDASNISPLSQRGPDAIRTHRVVTRTHSSEWHLTFTSSVLSLRGDTIIPQPVIDKETGSIFCWNGEAWLFEDGPVTGNDTQAVSQTLFNVVHNSTSPSCDIPTVFDKIAGPYAFVFYDATSQTLYFGRDRLGRRSLLLDMTNIEDGELTISSVNTSHLASTIHEVGTEFVRTIDLARNKLEVTQTVPRPPPPLINRTIPSAPIPALPTNDVVSGLISQLKKSLEIRIKNVPTYTIFESNAEPSRVAILFSGGLDCTLLARLGHDVLPYDQPIDLLNVAFENPRVINARASKVTDSFGSEPSFDVYEFCPDRITGRTSFLELITICPQRLWRFVAVNVPYEEFLEHRSMIISLMHPHSTEMDLSIASALYFAARGKGKARLSANLQEDHRYTTTARVLLSGLGADELFGGYSRHAAAFNRNGYIDLIEELSIDFARIGTRNLGRDDRVMANWGRETRYPFLDESFVKFTLDLPVWQKCGFRHNKTIPKHFESSVLAREMKELHPDKLLLRCAMWRLGMIGAASEKKRAIQFGARTAKMQVGNSKGTDLVTIHSSWQNRV